VKHVFTSIEMEKEKGKKRENQPFRKLPI